MHSTSTELTQLKQARPSNDGLSNLENLLSKKFYKPDFQAIRVVLGAIQSHRLNLGDPAWLFVVAPPGSGKTTMTIMGTCGLPEVVMLGDFSESTFISGFHGHSRPGILEKLGPAVQEGQLLVTKGDGILVAKDFTTVLSMRREKRAEILAQLREIHDGQFKKDFGTGVSKVWKGRVTMIAAPKSRRSIRAKHLLAGLKQSLERHRSLTLYKAAGDFVFANGAGRPLDPDDLRKRVLYPAMDKAGIERKTARAYGFHLFRHSAGTQMHEATGDLKQTQSFLGHSGISVTSDVYVHLQPDSEIESMQKLEKAFFSEPCSIVCSTKGEGNQEEANYKN